MKFVNFMIFLSIVLVIYGSANYYIFIRGWQVIPRETVLRYLYLGVFLALSLSYIFGRILERFTICAASNICIWIGSFWFGLMLYLLLGVLLADILRFGNFLFGFFPQQVIDNYGRAKQAAAVVVTALSAAIIVYGYFNAFHTRITRIDLAMHKKAGSLKMLDIALVTDIHLGNIVSNSRLEKMVKAVNGIKPDIVLLAGDIVDEDLAPVIKNNLGETLKGIRSRYGTYAVTGNHEFIGGVEAACRYLADHNVTVLRDVSILIDKSFYLVGREDRSISQFIGRYRKPLEMIMEGKDKSLPVILMDHQPFRLYRASDNGVDLQLSGHTHHGQLWPASIITGLIFEVSRGYKKIDDTHYYVSSGFGTWGPPSRVGSPSEVVHIRITFSQ